MWKRSERCDSVGIQELVGKKTEKTEQEVAYKKRSFKEEPIDIPAQTSLCSAIGKISLDNTFDARETLNGQVVMALDEAAGNWRVKVLRYEVNDIQPPRTVLEAMEKQMKAKREKRAEIARSEEQIQAILNKVEGDRGEVISLSEGEKIKRINEVEGRAMEILKVMEATAAGIHKVAEALSSPGGRDAANLEVAKQFVAEFGKMAKANNTMIVPANLSGLSSMVASAMATLGHVKQADQPEQS